MNAPNINEPNAGREADRHRCLRFNYNSLLPSRASQERKSPIVPEALSSNGIPNKIVFDKSGVNAAGIRVVNRILRRFGCPTKIRAVKSKYFNNLIEQDHRFI